MPVISMHFCNKADAQHPLPPWSAQLAAAESGREPGRGREAGRKPPIEREAGREPPIGREAVHAARSEARGGA